MPEDNATLTEEQKRNEDRAQRVRFGVEPLASDNEDISRTLEGTRGKVEELQQQISARDAEEPTIVTDTTIRDEVIPDLKDRADRLTERGQFVDDQGNLRDADGSIADEEDDTDPLQEGIDELFGEAEDLDAEILETIRSMRRNTDADTTRRLRTIEAQYVVKRQNLLEINRRVQAQTDTALLLGGSSRYTLSAAGISAGQERAGLMDIAELDALEKAEVNNIRAAESAQDFRTMELAVDRLEKTRQEKLKKATELEQQIANENKKIRELTEKIGREESIADAFTEEGITDAADIQEFLSAGGVKISVKDIQDVLDIINPDADKLSGLSADYKTYKQLQSEGQLSKKVSYLDYKTMLANATRKPTGVDAADIVGITSEDRRTLTGAGYTPGEINDIERSVSDFGIDAVLATERDLNKHNAIRKTYGLPDAITRETVERAVTQEVAEEALLQLYDDDELKELADEHGESSVFTGKKTDINRFLKSDKAQELYLTEVLAQYRDAGLLFEDTALVNNDT